MDSQRFKALGHPVRYRMFQVLTQDELCVCELTEFFDMSQPAVSQHIRQLKEAGLVVSNRRDQWTFYRAKPDVLYTACRKLIRGLEEDSDPIMERLDQLKRENLCEIRDSEGNLKHRKESSHVK